MRGHVSNAAKTTALIRIGDCKSLFFISLKSMDGTAHSRVAFAWRQSGRLPGKLAAAIGVTLNSAVNQ